MSYEVHTKETAPEASRDLMQAAEQKLGFCPNILAVMAESPAALGGYLALNEHFERSSLSAAERHLVMLAASGANQCTYCVPVYTMMAQSAGVAPDITDAYREGRAAADAKLEALRRLTSELTTGRGRASREALDAFAAAGYTRANLFEVITGIAIKTMTNYVNHVADVPLDQAFQKHAWQPPR